MRQAVAPPKISRRQFLNRSKSLLAAGCGRALLCRFASPGGSGPRRSQ